MNRAEGRWRDGCKSSADADPSPRPGALRGRTGPASPFAGTRIAATPPPGGAGIKPRRGLKKSLSRSKSPKCKRFLRLSGAKRPACAKANVRNVIVVASLATTPTSTSPLGYLTALRLRGAIKSIGRKSKSGPTALPTSASSVCDFRLFGVTPSCLRVPISARSPSQQRHDTANLLSAKIILDTHFTRGG